MKNIRINKSFINNLPNKLNRDQIYWDSILSGFGLRVKISEIKSYIIQYRQAGKSRRMTLGKHGVFSPDQARKLAREMMARVTHGRDLAKEKYDVRHAPDFSDLAQDYLDRHAIPNKRESSIKEDKRMIRLFLLPKLSGLKVASIGRRGIELILIRMKSIPYQANRVRALLSKMFSLAVDWGWVERNPVLGIPKYQEEKRMR